MSGVQEIKDCAAEWLERADRPDWSEEDAKELEAWLSQSPSHRLAYWRVKSAWDRAQRLHVLHKPARRRLRRTFSPRLNTILARSAAAVVILAVAAATGLYLTSRPQETLYSTEVGGRQVVALADGSKIELNTDTRLRVSFSAHNRRVVLEKGEAFFQVHHDENRLFTVLAGNRRITDLGTKFFVRSDDKRFEVALLEGRAALDAPDGSIKQPVMLAPGDVVKQQGRKLVVERKPETVLSNELGWRQGVIVFTHATLAEAAAEFNRYNRQKIRISDPQVARLTIGGTFEADNIDAFARLVRSLLDVKVTRQGNETVISQK